MTTAVTKKHGPEVICVKPDEKGAKLSRKRHRISDITQVVGGPGHSVGGELDAVCDRRRSKSLSSIRISLMLLWRGRRRSAMILCIASVVCTRTTVGGR